MEYPSDATSPAQDSTTAGTPQAGRTTPNTNPLPPLQNAPQTRRLGTAAAGSNSPDFLRGLQLADSGARAGRQSHQSLLAPAQFHGSFFGSSGSVTVSADNGSKLGRLTADIPAAGGNARFNVADNNKGLPQNRVFFDYRHFSTLARSISR